MSSRITKFFRASTYRTIGYDSKIAVPHHDNSIEIIQFWSEGGYFIVRNNIFPIKPGLVLIINALDIHYANPANVPKYNRNKLVISTDCFNQICSLCDLTNLSSTIIETGGCMFLFDPAGSDFKQIDCFFKEIHHNLSHAEETPSAQMTVIDYVIRMLNIISQSKQPKYSINGKDNSLEQLASHINNQLASWEDISLDNICKELHLSRSYAANLFKKLTNTSITQYTMDLRISEAKKLLITTDLKIVDIADALNFKDSTTFCKTFKKYVGCTPRTYRMTEGVVQPLR